MKNISKLSLVTLAAISSLVTAQPSFALSNHNAPLLMAQYRVRCCGGANTASAQMVTIPGHGPASLLQITDSSRCCDSFAEAKIEGITFDPGVPIKKAIKFSVTGPGLTAADMTNFEVHVDYLPPGALPANYLTYDFTVANGGLKPNGPNSFVLATGTHLLPPGSLLFAVDFFLLANCSSNTQTVYIQNVYVDNTVCHFDPDSRSASCIED